LSITFVPRVTGYEKEGTNLLLLLNLSLLLSASLLLGLALLEEGLRDQDLLLGRDGPASCSD
jgi:hypothetical protein